MRLQTVDEIELETTGIRGDRRFYLVDDEGALVNAKRLPALLTVRPTVDDGRLILRFPDDSTVEGEVRDSDESIETSFFGRPVAGRIVEGPVGEPRCPSSRGSPCASRGRSARATATTAGEAPVRRSSRPRRSTRCGRRQEWIDRSTGAASG